MTCLLSYAGVPVSLEIARRAAAEALSCIQFAALPCALSSMPVVRLVAFGLEALIAGHDVAAGQKIGWTEAIGPFDDLGIEEGLAHAEERRGQENCVLVFCADLRLART